MNYYTRIPSPIGILTLVGNDRALTAIHFENDKHPQEMETAREDADHPILRRVRQQLDEYFAGRREEFDVPLSPTGTEFQQSVWKALRQIAFGQTCSYGDIARKIENPKAVRAVGLANGANPIPIIIPCHRVIGANGALTGYGGGLDRKRLLLSLEKGKAAAAA